MKEQTSAGRTVFRDGVRLLAGIVQAVKENGKVTAWCAAGAVLGALCLWQGYRPLAFSTHAQGSGNTFTSFDVSAAGKGAYQGTIGVSINASGEVAGIYLDSSLLAHGFVRTADGTITTFDSPHAGTSLTQGTFPASINAGGDVTGMYSDANKAYRGFVRLANGTITEFDAPGAPTTTGHRGTIPASINTAGEIAGFIKDAGNVRHGFLRAANGTFTTFDVAAAGTGAQQGTQGPVVINSAGIIAGNYLDSNMLRHGFVRAADGTITSFDPPGAAKYTGGVKDICCGGTLPMSIDTAGDVAGGFTDANGVAHGFVRAASDGTITTFDAPNAGTSGASPVPPGTIATSVNTSGVITGAYKDANGVAHGFLRSIDGTIASFDEPDAGTSGIAPVPSGTYGMSINDSGVVAGAYSDASGVVHGFVYTPGQPQTATPTFDPAAGTYYTAQTVSISDTTTGAVIYYTTDGTTPTTSSTAYSSPIPVPSTLTIEAIAVATGYANSEVATATYTISAPPAAAPTFSPSAGTYTSAQTVTLSDTTQGATIYYTTNGTTPTTSSTVYSGPITVSSTETIEAMALASGYSNSAVATATYTINLPTPDFQLSVQPSTLTIVAGQSGKATFTVTPVNGFNSPVSFACSGLPAEATCSFSPSSVTPNGSPISSTLTVTTTAPSAALYAPVARSWRPIYAFVFPAFGMLLAVTPHRKRALRGVRLLGLLLLLMVAAGLTSCGSGSTSGGNSGTPIGTDTVSVSASASGTGAANHTATLTITITH